MVQLPAVDTLLLYNFENKNNKSTFSFKIPLGIYGVKSVDFNNNILTQ